MMKNEEVVGEDGLLHCSVCGERVERELDFPSMDGSGKSTKMKVHCMCKCRREEKAKEDARMEYEAEMRRIDELRQLSLMDAKLKEVRFSSYSIDEKNGRVFNIAKKYVDNFDEMYKQNQGILFYGDVGTGKSYTAAAIANELLERMCPVIMTSFIKLLQDMGSFERDDGEYIGRLNRAKLLIIDDLGAERGTDFALEKVYNIVDSRYRSGKPVIFTTNLELSQMKSCDDIRYNRIYDRIYEMCYPVKMDGISWRKKQAAARFSDMKKILEG